MAKGCGSGLPCVYVSRDQWIPVTDVSVYKPHPIVGDSWKKPETTLFIMIASFRDKLCPITLFNLFSKAKYPKRVSIGLVDQRIEEDGDDCVKQYCKLINEHNKNSDCQFKDQIRVILKNAHESKGPTWARAYGSTLLEEEEFCMQTDSHMDFVSDWDDKMMEMWSSVNNEYAILSTYVTDSSELPHLLDGQKGVNGLHEVPHLCMVTLDGANGLVRNHATKSARMLEKPKLTNAIWGAGLSFSKCHAERKVPYDPHTPQIFDGEEYSRAARYWTYGYDIYTPNRVYVVHNYHVSQSDPTHSAWGESFNSKEVDQSVHRLKTLFGMPGNTPLDMKEVETLRKSKYGLGDRRSYDQLIEFSGIDTVNRKILSNRCGNIAYVPFVEHVNGPNHIPAFDTKTEEFLGEYDEGSVWFTSRVKHGFVGSSKQAPHEPIVPPSSSSSLLRANQAINKVGNNENNKLFSLPIETIKAHQTESSGAFVMIIVAVALLVYLSRLRSLSTSSTKKSNQQQQRQQSTAGKEREKKNTFPKDV